MSSSAPSFVLADSGNCGFCGKARRCIALLPQREPQICIECTALCCEGLATPEPSRSGALPVDETASPENKLRFIMSRMGKNELPDDEATYDRLRPSVDWGDKGPPLTYDAYRCSFCHGHRREVDLVSGRRWLFFVCEACVAAATAALSIT